MRALLLVLVVACASTKSVKKAETCKQVDNESCVERLVDKYLALLFYSKDDNTKVSRYVNDVLARLARASGDRRPWKAVVLDDEDTNAFVTMGSTIYVLRGTLEVLRSEAELAAVLGHEMGHLRGGHARERWADLIRNTPRSAAEEMRDNRYARDDEIQADEHAVLLLEKAGYDTGAIATMMSALAGSSKREAVADDPEATHPWWPERIARVQALIGLRPEVAGERGEARYRAGMATLISGKDPRRYASRIDDAAVFAKLKLAVDLPAGKIDPKDPDSTTTVVLPDGATASVVAGPADWVMLFAAIEPTDTLVFETEVIGSEMLVWIFEGKDARKRIKELRKRKRRARPDELARVRPPTYVDFDAPRRVWRKPTG